MAVINGTPLGDEIFSMSVDADTLIGGAGNDTLGNDPRPPAGGAVPDGFFPGTLLDGGDGDDILIESPFAPDTLIGGAGNDEFSGFAIPGADFSFDPATVSFPTDLIDAGAGADTILGGFSAFTGFAGHDGDLVNGGDLGDVIYGNQGLDTLTGGNGDDTIYGGQNEGSLTPIETQPTRLAAQEGVEFLFGDGGLEGFGFGAGNDLMYGNLGSDVMEGGGGADTLFGGQGADTLSGGDGADMLLGNRGDDVLAGGTFVPPDAFFPFPGAVSDGVRDDFFFGAPGALGEDTIIGFEAGIDKINLPLGVVFSIQTEFDDVVIRFTGSESSITISNLPGGDVAGDILFF